MSKWNGIGHLFSFPSGLSAVLALGLGAPPAETRRHSVGPADQPQETDCAALNAEKTRLLAERDELSIRRCPHLRRRLNEKLSSPN